MSLILQALRKSEAERRLGQAPSLLSPMPALRTTRKRGWRGAGYVLALMLVAALAWWLGQRGPHREAAAPATTAPLAATGPAPPPSARRPVPASPALVESTAITLRPAPVSPPRTAAAKPSLPSNALPAAKPAAAAVTAPAVVVAEPPPSAAAPAPATPPALPSLAQLPAAERQSLPALRITMHVFAEQPAQRFAIIDGHRVAEGALLGEGVVLAEITRAGVILDLHGQRVLLARP